MFGLGAGIDIPGGSLFGTGGATSTGNQYGCGVAYYGCGVICIFLSDCCCIMTVRTGCGHTGVEAFGSAWGDSDVGLKACFAFWHPCGSVYLSTDHTLMQQWWLLWQLQL